MPLSRCRYCHKSIPNIYHKYHEQSQCLVMRKLRGDSDMIMRELPSVDPVPVKGKHQKRLLEFFILS